MSTSGGRLLPAGRSIWAYSMYVRGKQFYGAAFLLRKQVGVFNHVPLYLECLSMEVTLKGILLLKDFEKNRKNLRKFGHNLEVLMLEVVRQFQLNEARSDLLAELRLLNKFYSDHLMRYGGIHDIFIDPRSISSQLTARRLRATIRLAEREIRKRPEIVESMNF